MTTENLFLTAAVVCGFWAFGAPALAQGQPPAREAVPPPRPAELGDTVVIPLEQFTMASFIAAERRRNPFTAHADNILAALDALDPRPPFRWPSRGRFGGGFGGFPNGSVNPWEPRASGMSGGVGGGAPGLNPLSGTAFQGGFGGGRASGGGGGRGSR